MDRYSAGVCFEIRHYLYTLHTKGVAYTVRLSIDHRWEKKRQGKVGRGRGGKGMELPHIYFIFKDRD